MNDRKKVDDLILKHGYEDYKWIDPWKIIVAQWVRLKCMFGCPEYGHSASCPPNTPDVADCVQFFREYREGVVFHFSQKVEKPEDRHAWTRKTNQALLKLERDVFLAGYRKAFLLFMDSCTLCPDEDCGEAREVCKQPMDSRPAPESMAVDVFGTVQSFGYSIKVLTDYDQAMDRFAFLLVR